MRSFHRAACGAAALATLLAPVPGAVAKPRCLTFADARGDSGRAAPLGDDALDVTNVRFLTTGQTLVAQVTVASFASRPALATGGRYEAAFTVGGHDVGLYWTSGPVESQLGKAFSQQGVRVDGEFVAASVTGRVEGDTVSLAVSLGTLRSVLHSKVERLRATDVSVTASATYANRAVEWDAAPGPATGFALGAACR